MRPIPRWANWLDALAIILLLVAARVAFGHSFRLAIAGFTPVIGDAWRPTFAAVLLLSFRHWRVRVPSLPARAWGFVRAWRHEPHASILRLGLASRLGVLLVGIVAAVVIGRPADLRQRVSDDAVIDVASRWDVPWYSGIAREGYSYDARYAEARQQTIAFFPAFPMLLRVADAFTQPQRRPDMTLARYVELRESRLAWAGSAISIGLFLSALLIMYRWVELKGGPDAALGSVLLLAAYPFAVFYSAAYTESLFLLTTVGACFFFERERWGLAVAFGVLAGLTRPNGAMLSLTLGLLACLPLLQPLRDRSVRRLAIRLGVAATPGVGMLLFSAFVYTLAGDPFAWMKVQQAWGRSFASSVSYLEWSVGALRDQGLLFYLNTNPIQMLQTMALLFALGMVWPVWRRLGAPYAVFLLANILPPLFKGGALSMGRMTSTLFPMFAALALAIPPHRRGSWMLFFALGQGLIAVLFFTWRPVY